MMESLARICYRHRWPVVGVWVLLIVALFGIGQIAGTGFRTEFAALPGTESKAAFDILQNEGFSERTGEQVQIVFTAESGVSNPDIQREMERFFDEIGATIPNATVNSPYAPGGERQIATDGTVAYAEINLADRSQEAYREAGEAIQEHGEEIDVAGLQVEYGGNIFISEEGGGASEGIGVLGAIIILLIAFGSLLAMGLPIITALFGVGTGVAMITVATRFLDMPDFTIAAAAMIGIGVGIDYALFIVTRYRQGLREGLAPEGATARALGTAGRAVLFAGITVVISVMGMFALNLDMISGMAVAISLTVLMTMLAAVTLLPAILGFTRERIDRLGLPWRNQRHANGDTFWHRWSRVIQNRPWAAALGGLLLLLLLTIPFFSMRLGFSDAGNRPTTDTTRRAYDLLSDGFGPGFNGPFLLAAETPNGQADIDALAGLSGSLNDTEGVVFASQPIANESHSAAIIQVIPSTSPQSAETEELVHRLRNGAVNDALTGADLDVHVGGLTPTAVDFSEYTADRLPLFFGGVLTLSFLLLMLVFRSVLVPLKAVVMNLLSIGSAFGLTVAVFQWGWFANLIGVAKEGPIEAWAPMMIFAIVFGLSMDYEVFLLSRIREEYDKSRDNASAVADGLANTARVITAAAAIMIFVFGGFVLGDDRALKLLGFGLATAVLIDATIVRLILVPATMELLGDRNWWLPGWLRRLLPTVQLEGATSMLPEHPPQAAPEHSLD